LKSNTNSKIDRLVEANSSRADFQQPAKPEEKVKEELHYLIGQIEIMINCHYKCSINSVF